jgi:hypothetical protein
MWTKEVTQVIRGGFTDSARWDSTGSGDRRWAAGGGRQPRPTRGLLAPLLLRCAVLLSVLRVDFAKSPSIRNRSSRDLLFHAFSSAPSFEGLLQLLFKKCNVLKAISLMATTVMQTVFLCKRVSKLFDPLNYDPTEKEKELLKKTKRSQKL